MLVTSTKMPSETHILSRIISGGQTGVDRAALDVALLLHIDHGGYCPMGRLAEDGRIPNDYRLIETRSPDYEVRTERNILASDGTLVLSLGEPVGGTALTVELSLRHNRPLLHIDLQTNSTLTAIQTILSWIVKHQIETLNVAGPRESEYPIYDEAHVFLTRLFTELRRSE